MPQPVKEYQEIYAEAKNNGFSKPHMPPAVQEYYSILDYSKRLGSIARCKDRKSGYDLEAVTEEIAFHIKQTHPINDNKAIALMKFLPEYYQPERVSQMAFTIEELSAYKLFRLTQLGKKANLYITNCDFVSNYSRKASYVKSVSALIVDIDYYTVPTLEHMTAEDVYSKIVKEVFMPIKMPPTYGIASGKGLYLVFLTETMDLKDNRHNQQVYQKLMDKLLQLTLAFGADLSCRDLSRVLRLPTTINRKTGAMAHIINFDTVRSSCISRYSIQQIANILGVETIEKPIISARPKTNLNKPPRSLLQPVTGGIGTLKTLGEARAQDLLKWLHNRSYDIEGNRNTFFLILSASLLAYMSEEKAFEYIQSVNRKLINPQPSSELIGTFRGAVKNAVRRKDDKCGYYSFTNEYIITHLSITDNEMTKFKTIISEKEKNKRDYEHRKAMRRNEQGNTQREQAKQDKIQRILELQAEGKTQAQIACILEISRQLVSRYIKLSTETVAV